MDPLDLAIYRALSPGGEARFWAGRRVLDPRIPARAIAAAVGVSENGVRLRLASLAERGFLRDRAVVPNPSLFGLRVFVTEVSVGSATDVERIYRDLELVEGVMFARDTMAEGERKVQVYFVAESEEVVRRRATLVGRLGGGSAAAPQPYWIPTASAELTPLDWRLLRAAVAGPDGTIAETVRRVPVGLKTGGRRYHRLIDTTAAWWTHGPRSEEFPLAFVRLDLRHPSDRATVLGRIGAEEVPWVPVAADGLGEDPGLGRPVVAGLTPADAPTVLERRVHALAAVPGVTSVRRTFALGSRSYPTWFAARLEAQAGVRSRAP